LIEKEHVVVFRKQDVRFPAEGGIARGHWLS
jgi:hypothetical protein